MDSEQPHPANRLKNSLRNSIAFIWRPGQGLVLHSAGKRALGMGSRFARSCSAAPLQGELPRARTPTRWFHLRAASLGSALISKQARSQPTAHCPRFSSCRRGRAVLGCGSSARRAPSSNRYSSTSLGTVWALFRHCLLHRHGLGTKIYFWGSNIYFLLSLTILLLVLWSLSILLLCRAIPELRWLHSPL